jgi:hypothetical protein
VSQSYLANSEPAKKSFFGFRSTCNGHAEYPLAFSLLSRRLARAAALFWENGAKRREKESVGPRKTRISANEKNQRTLSIAPSFESSLFALISAIRGQFSLFFGSFRAIFPEKRRGWFPH